MSPFVDQLRVTTKLHLPSPLEPLSISPFDELAQSLGIHISIKRDDLIHPYVSGNKWRKLVGYYERIHQERPPYVISFGGAYSNHLIALATINAALNIQTIAIIRGESPRQWNERLLKLKALGVILHFVSRTEYRRREEISYQSEWLARYPNAHIIPEGGTSHDALSGMRSLVDEVRDQVSTQGLSRITDWVTPLASGGTMAGLLAASQSEENVHGISVLKGAEYLADRVYAFADNAQNHVDHGAAFFYWDMHGGGYAKANAKLLSTIEAFRAQGMPCEPVYTGKVLSALATLIDSCRFRPGAHIVMLHTGGVWPEPVSAADKMQKSNQT